MHPISDQIFVDGTLRAAHSDARIAVLNPVLGTTLGQVPDGNAQDIDDAVTDAMNAAPQWAATPARERGAVLGRLAVRLRDNCEALATLDSLDCGRTLAETRAQVMRSAEQLDYCAGAADKLEGRVVPLGGEFFAATTLEPYGVVAALTPWNAPLLQIAQKTSHAIAAGNTVVVKPSPLACFSTLYYALLAGKAGLPTGVLNVVTGGSEPGRALVADERVAKVTFTGSIATGRGIASVCGGRGATVALELGGKCPMLVFADADLGKAAQDAARAAFGTTGQSCVSAARILIEDSCYEDFVALLAAESERYIGGDPLQPGTVMGPMISAAARQHVRELVVDALGAGAKVVGGYWPQPLEQDGGFFMNAVLLAEVADRARITREEIFGPVSCLERFDDEVSAITAANAGPYGLAAGAYTSSAARARRLQRALHTGNVWINCYKCWTRHCRSVATKPAALPANAESTVC